MRNTAGTPVVRASSWVRLDRGLRSPRVLGGAVAKVIGTARQRVDWGVAAHRLHEGDQLPDLFVGNLVSERRHSVRPALDNRLEDVRRLTAVDPPVVHQRWSHPAAAVGMTTAAV